MEKVFGIDVSKFQGDFDFKKAKNEGVKFAILRAGYTGSSNGTSKDIDPKFETYYKNAKNNGLGVGAYWFSRATSYDKGKAEAEYMYNNCLKGKQFEYPIAIDVEDNTYQKKAGKSKVTEAIKGFCEYLEGKGYYVVIYANVDWFKNYIDTSKLIAYDKWVASWGTTKPTSPEAGIWQFGGDTNKIRINKIAGITCDQDYAYKDYPTIMKQKGLNGYKKEESKTSTSTKTTTPSNSSSNASTNNENSKYYKKYNGKSNSLVEALISLNIGYSFAYRFKIAKANGISLYLGTASQNIKLLNLLKEGKLKKV